MEEAQRKFRFSDLGRLLLNSLKAIFKGEFLLRLRLGDYLLHITWCFFIVALTIWLSLMIDKTMTKVERGKAILTEQKEEIAQREFELERITSRSAVLTKLEEMGSPLREPQQRAYILTSEHRKTATSKKSVNEKEAGSSGKTAGGGKTAASKKTAAIKKSVNEKPKTGNTEHDTKGAAKTRKSTREGGR